MSAAEVVVATSNPGKLREIRAILADLEGLRVRTVGVGEAGAEAVGGLRAPQAGASVT